jgi:putative selenate reductase
MPTPDLYPIPFPTLVSRLDLELAAGGSLFGIDRRDWWVPDPSLDTSIVHLGKRLATPSGPASGPHTQLAQNLVLSWLTGGRFLELKTVQIDDELVIPRPCIHAPHVGYNVEWSQELRVPQSALEYVKGWMLVHMLAGAPGPGLWPGVEASWDLSLGYDLAGIRSERIGAYIASLRDARPLIDALRRELPPRLQRWADVPVPATVCDSVTLSTFHGCPAHEIEAIAAWTLEQGLHTVVKLNPTLLGHDRCRALLDRLGYGFVRLRRDDFDRDLQWDAMLGIVQRMTARATALGLRFGVKLSNTLVHRSDEPPFGDTDVYLSGPPLHAISFQLAAELRAAVPGPLPITFSAGIDGRNFTDVVASGLAPATACTDLLKGRGYANQTRYVRGLEAAMRGAGVADVDGLRRALGGGDDPEQAARAHLACTAAGVVDDPRYARAANQKPPRKIGSHLELLDCLTCDKCIPVCPNAANFAVPLPIGEHRPGRVRWSGDARERADGEPLVVGKKHQIGNVIEACNLCGSCDVWCPEDGGPYIVKPHLYVTGEAWADHPRRDGFRLLPGGGIAWRRGAEELRWLPQPDGAARFEVPGGALLLRDDQPVASEGTGDVDLRDAVTLRLFHAAFVEAGERIWLAPPPESPP